MNLKWCKCLPEKLVYQQFDSPVGELFLLASSDKLYAVLWESTVKQNLADSYILDNNNLLLKATIQQLNQYFHKERRQFDLPLSAQGTEFQQQAWKELSTIPYGQTISYGEQARRLGDKNKARAVGLANGCNPLSIVVPCHRVIGANGSLTGFGGGLQNKAFLLSLEAS